MNAAGSVAGGVTARTEHTEPGPYSATIRSTTS